MKRFNNAKTIEEIISDKELDDVHGNANFGGTSKRDVIKYGLLKCAFGYYQGHTSTRIITEHKLVTKNYKLTKKGLAYMKLAFYGEIKFKV